MSKQISPEMRDELTSLSVTYRDAKSSFERHRDRWHNAIVDAVDAGMRPADVAGVVGVSPQRILAIVARVYAKSD